MTVFVSVKSKILSVVRIFAIRRRQNKLNVVELDNLKYLEVN